MMVGQQVDAMANPRHLAKIKEGVGAWNKWRHEHPKARPDLSDADLAGANLGGANLGWADLAGARLAGATLDHADLNGAQLDGAELSSTNLLGARFICASLVSANLHGADLSFTNLAHADFYGADLDDSVVTGASFSHTRLVNNDLSSVIGLAAARHSSPSAIGIDTIYRSKGHIPESFLRGCGVPDDFITYVKSLTANPIQFYSCFISYSTKDQAFADRLYADLQNQGVRCWFAPHDVQGGRKLHEQIDEAIRLHDKLLLILSPHSMASEWVKTEIAKARNREVRDPEGVQKRRVLFPIRLAPFETLRDWECFDADTGKDSAREIREYFIPDFSNWKDHDSYQDAFQRLISDLKASDANAK
jgi:uncharacterized protein YjbI with pentapeptide repeats